MIALKQNPSNSVMKRLWCVNSLLISKKKHMFHNNPKYLDRQAYANSVDPDQAHDQGLHCLQYIQQYFRHTNRYQNGLFQILGQVSW